MSEEITEPAAPELQEISGEPVGLAEYLAAHSAPIEASEPERWTITDDGGAAWAVKMLRNLRVQIEMNNDLAVEERERVTTWQNTVNSPLTNNAGFFEFHLKNYALDQRRDFDRKSIKLPHGTLSTREGSIAWAIDEVAFIAWAKVNAPDLVKIVESPRLAEAQKVLTITEDGSAVSPAGELVPGVATSQKPHTFKVETF